MGRGATGMLAPRDEGSAACVVRNLANNHGNRTWKTGFD